MGSECADVHVRVVCLCYVAEEGAVEVMAEAVEAAAAVAVVTSNDHADGLCHGVHGDRDSDSDYVYGPYLGLDYDPGFYPYYDLCAHEEDWIRGVCHVPSPDPDFGSCYEIDFVESFSVDYCF